MYRKRLRLQGRPRPLRGLRLPRFFREPLSHASPIALVLPVGTRAKRFGPTRFLSGDGRRFSYWPNLANLRLRAEAQYSLALLHSTQSLRVTQINASGVNCSCNCSRARSADQRITGGWSSHGGAEARRKQREETTTRHKGNWRVPCFCLCVKHPWLPTGVLHRPGHPSCAGAYMSLANKLMRYGVDALPTACAMYVKKK
jgi:hypothetical protein